MTIKFMLCSAAPTGHCVVNGPIGRWWLEWCDKGLLAVSCTDAAPQGDPLPLWLSKAWEQFWKGKDYDLTLVMSRPFSPFFDKVYHQLARVLQGDTLSYGKMAELCGSPGAARAVGQAMRLNPWPLFLPCHRVIGSTGALVGYVGKKHLALKRQLLDYEQKMRSLSASFSGKLGEALEALGGSKETEY